MRYSIIIPVYNTKDYLATCINSCVNQTYPDIQIILVNDGSTDGSKELCEEYAKKDSRIVLVNKENGGLSDARNIGIKRAEGEYVILLDSDDYLELDACEKIDEKLEGMKVDVVCASVREWRTEKSIVWESSGELGNRIVTGQEVLKTELKNNTWKVMAWANIYRREFLVDHRLFFRKGILHEDMEWSPRVFLAAKTCLDTNVCFYNYVKREGSITTKKSYRKNFEDVSGFIPDLVKQIECLEDMKLKDLLFDYLCYGYLSTYYTAMTLEKFECDLDYKLLDKIAKSPKNKLKVRLLKFSPAAYCRVNSLSKRILQICKK